MPPLIAPPRPHDSKHDLAAHMEGLTAAQTTLRDKIANFLTARLNFTDKNAASVIRTVTDLMAGRGLASEHLPGPRWLEGFVYDPLRHNPKQLRELGKQWLPPRRPRRHDGLLDRVYDSKKGHTIDHAAGCLIKYNRLLNKPTHLYEPIPQPPPPPTAEQLKAVADRPFSAGGPKRERKRKPAKRPREEETAALAKLKKSKPPPPPPPPPPPRYRYRRHRCRSPSPTSRDQTSPISTYRKRESSFVTPRWSSTCARTRSATGFATHTAK